MGENVNSAELVEYKGHRIYPEVAEYLTSEVRHQRAEQDARLVAERWWQDTERAMYRAAEDEGRTFDRYGNDADDRKYREGRTRYRELLTEASRVGRANRDLLLNSPHREVKWIAENCLFADQGSEVENYARNILAILPATVDEIWEEAKDNRGMCDVFDRFYESAERAGVFNDGNMPVAYKEMAALRNYVRRTYGHGYARDLMPHVDRIVKALKDHHDKEMEAAKAEWQGLDEAWRSERSRRAAATRRAMAEGTVSNTPSEGVRLEDVPRPVGWSDTPGSVTLDKASA